MILSMGDQLGLLREINSNNSNLNTNLETLRVKAYA